MVEVVYLLGDQRLVLRWKLLHFRFSLAFAWLHLMLGVYDGVVINYIWLKAAA